MLERVAAALGERYTVERELGSGATATVYLATDRRHGRRVAIKVLRPELTALLSRRRFLREIEIAATLAHPNILPLHDSGETAGLLYFVMPYIQGRSLADRLEEEGALTVEDAVRIAQQVARALHYAHQHGIVHRDIKPANVLLVDDQAIVADFGIARAGESLENERLTGTGLSLGTPHYMSPEHVAGAGELDGRADIYSLGCMLFEMIAGRPPFEGGTAHALLVRHAIESVPRLRTVRPGVPADLERVAARAVEKDPADRFATAGELEEALELVRAGAGALPSHGWGWPRVPRVVALAGVAAVLAIVAATALLRRDAMGPAEGGLDPSLIAVAPFRVTSPGDPSFADFEGGLPELLYMRLGGEGGARTVYPGTAAPVWDRLRERGELTDSAVFRGARSLGAGRALLGHVLVSGDEAVLNAALFSTADGAPVARTTDVRGPVDSLVSLVDRLSVELLSRSAGEPEQRLPHFAASDLEAVRAYLAGQAAYHESRFAEAVEHFIRALDLDSTFALAGLQLAVADSYVGPSMRGAVRGLNAAWAHRDRLSSRDQVFLEALGGPDWPRAASLADQVRAWEAAAEAMPDRKDVLFQLGDYLFHYGAYVGAPSPWTRAGAAFRQALAIDPRHGPALGHLIELAARARDTTTMGLLVDRYLAGSTRDYRDYYRWRLAQLRGDSAFLARFRDSIPRLEVLSLERISGSGQLDGLGLEDAELAARAFLERGENLREAYDNMRYLALNRGRPAEALEWRRQAREHGIGVQQAPLVDVFDALYWDGDSAVAVEAVRERAYVDEAVAPDGPPDPLDPLYTDLCAVSLWRVGRDQNAGVRRTVELLRDAARRAVVWQAATPRLCAAVVDAELAVTTGRADARSAVGRLDSLSAVGLPTSWELLAAANLTAAKLLERQGELDRALAAVRRRSYAVDRGEVALSTFFLEEGRLALAVGDTAGAIHAYQAYLNLRSGPEPPLVPAADSVRSRLRLLEASSGPGRGGASKAGRSRRPADDAPNVFRTPPGDRGRPPPPASGRAPEPPQILSQYGSYP